MTCIMYDFVLTKVLRKNTTHECLSIIIFHHFGLININHSPIIATYKSNFKTAQIGLGPNKKCLMIVKFYSFIIETCQFNIVSNRIRIGW